MTMLDWDNPLETQTHNKTDVDSALVSNTLSRAASYKEVQTPSEEPVSYTHLTLPTIYSV